MSGSPKRPPILWLPGLLVGLLLLLLVWTGTVAHWQLTPPESMVGSPSVWTQWLWQSGLLQCAGFVVLYFALLGRRGLAFAWLVSLGWLGSYSPEGASIWLPNSGPITIQTLPLSLLVAALVWFFPRSRHVLLSLVAVQATIWLKGSALQMCFRAALGVLCAETALYLWSLQGSQSEAEPTQGRILSWNLLASLVMLLSSIWLIRPGEEWFNRLILIRAQKTHQSLAQLLVPQDLRWWTHKIAPTTGLDLGSEKSEDLLELSNWLHQQPLNLGVVLVQPSSAGPPELERSWLSALADGRPISLLSFKDRQQDGKACLVVLGPHQPLPAVVGPDGLSQMPTVALQAKHGSTVYQLPIGNMESHLFAHPEAPSSLGVSEIAKQIRIRFPLPESFPSRGLCRLETSWSWNGTTPVDLSQYRVMVQVLQPETGVVAKGPVQSIAWKTDGRDPQQMPIYFSTPEPEGWLRCQIRLIDQDQQSAVVEEFRIRSWRRLPALGF